MRTFNFWGPRLFIELLIRLKYTFGPYFCQNYSIWSLFSLFGKFGPHFCKISC